jgi:hypothetical protein
VKNWFQAFAFKYVQLVPLYAQGAAEGFVGDFEVPCDKQLAIVDIGVDKDAPAGCLHIFPAVLSLVGLATLFTAFFCSQQTN